MRKIICAIICCYLSLFNLCFAALPTGVVWDISTTGSDTNGGFFVTGATGTDYSQSDSAHCTATDLVLVTSTTATSATCPFGADSVGNGVNISAGTGFTVQFCDVQSVSGVTATLLCASSTAGTGGSTGGSFKLGGRLATVGKNLATTAITSDNNITYIKSGTYTSTTQRTIPNVNSNSWIGYSVTHGDGLGTVIVTSATNSVDIFGFSSENDAYFENLTVSSTAATRGNCFANNASAGAEKLTLNRVIIDGCNYGIYGDWNIVWTFAELKITNSEIKNCISHGVNNSGSIQIYSSYIHDNGGDGVRWPQNGGFAGGTRANSNIQRSVFYKNAVGYEETGPANGNQTSLVNNVFSDNTAQGIKIVAPPSYWNPTIANNIFYNNGTYGIDATAPITGGLVSAFMNYNAFGANGTAALHNLTAGANDVTLTADPFTARASANFAPNSTAGGGAAIKGAGFPGATALFGTGSLDIGALQSAATSGASAFACVI